LYHTYRGHATEIVCLSFNPHGTMIATGSMDNTARLWDVEAGDCLHTLLGHTAEIVSLTLIRKGNILIITGSFDHTVQVWMYVTINVVSYTHGALVTWAYVMLQHCCHIFSSILCSSYGIEACQCCIMSC
jgi:WD40 repeat protein